MDSSSDITWMLACHEAGHAVVAWTLDVRFSRIDFAQCGGCTEHRVVLELLTLYRGLDPSSDGEGLERDAIVALAGEMAERAYELLYDLSSDEEREQLSQPIGSYASADDWKLLDDLMLKKFRSRDDPAAIVWLEEMKRRTEKRVEDNWDRIELLADALFKRGTISTYEDAVRIIESR